jgi:hypothetical protein
MANLDEIFSAGGEAMPSKEQTETQDQTTQDQTTADETSEDVEHADETKKTVPLVALQKEREKGAKRYTEQVADFERRHAESVAMMDRRFEQLVRALQPQQPKAPAPEFNWDNPLNTVDERVVAAVSPIEQKIAQQGERFSKALAVDKHGAEAVDAAYEAMSRNITANPQAAQFDYQRIMASPHPYGALVDWHKAQELASEVGADPAAYREKLKAEILAEIQGGQAIETPVKAPAVPAVMPSNFANARSVGARTGPTWSGPQPLSDIFNRSRG